MTEDQFDPAAGADGPGFPPPATNRMVVTLLALIGFFVALYLLAHNMGLTGPIAAIGGLLLVGSAVGLAFSTYLTYLEAFVINAWCQYCVISAILITLIFFFSLPEVGRLRGQRS